MKKISMMFLLLFSLPHLATTYVVKEGGKEVGRYDVNDGKADIVDEDGAKPAPVSRPKAAAKSSQTPAADVWGKKSPQAAAREDLRKQIEGIAQDAKKRTDEMKQDQESREYAKKNHLIYT